MNLATVQDYAPDLETLFQIGILKRCEPEHWILNPYLSKNESTNYPSKQPRRVAFELTSQWKESL
jgi:hypothetical protein